MTLARDPVALDVPQVRAGRRYPLPRQFDDPRFDDDTPGAQPGETIATGKHPRRTASPTYARALIMRRGCFCRPDASRLGHGSQNCLEVAPAAFAGAPGADAARARLNFILVAGQAPASPAGEFSRADGKR